MFAKPANFKPYAAIKNSERKNVLSNIEKQANLGEQTPEVRQKLLPKSVQAAKAITHGGEKILVYSEEQLPLWLVIRNKYVPTVVLLASLPADLQLKIVPVIYTVPNTIGFLQKGADFMIPGIFGDLPSDPTPKGTPVQIREIDSKAVMATGLALCDLSQVKEDDKGKGIQTVNVVGDKLTPQARMVTLENLNLNDTEAEPTAKNSGSDAAASTGTEPRNKNETAQVPTEDAIKGANSDQADQVDQAGHSEQTADIDELSQEEADEAFLYAVAKVIRQPHTYPMTMAGFAALLAENMPYEHPGLTIKTTSFKKMGKLLKHAEKDGQLVLRERQGGEVIVTSVNVPQGEALPEPVAPKPANKQKHKADKMTAILVYRPKPAMRAIMAEEVSSDDVYDASFLRKQVNQYVAAHKLSNVDGMITLDEPLRQALGQKQTVVSVKRDEVPALIVKNSTPLHKIVKPGDSVNDTPFSKGGIPSINIKTERRGGNKVVTLVGCAGVQGFHINPQELADELRHVCAGSATVTNVKGFDQIVVQGNHIVKIGRVLEKRGIKSSWIKT